MRINISLKEYDEIVSHYESAEHGKDIINFVNSYAFVVELMDEDRRIQGARDEWRELTKPIYEGEATLEILIYACVFLVNYWDYGEMFLTDVLTPFERAMVIETMIDITKVAEQRREEESDV